MTEIRLERGVWTIDEGDRLGPPGGFGEVFRGAGPDGEVAIKRLKLTASAAAHREMKIGQVLANRQLLHVVPVLDFGQDANSDRYYLVMPVCEQSLQELLSSNGPLDWDNARPIALDIIAGLSEVGDIVHRDLKPGNVLWHEGHWKVADFGIAKFVEDSTSLETLRDSLTPPYAAPEQWLGEPPTRATDVYALGCVLHTMINGKPPFSGDMDAIRRAHLFDPPPDLNGMPPQLNGLVHYMLRKKAMSRPNIARCTAVISTIEARPQRASNLALAAAGHLVAQEQASAEARLRAEETARREREAIAREATDGLLEIVERLFEVIEKNSGAARQKNISITLGPANLSLTLPQQIGKNIDNTMTNYGGGWEVLAGSSIILSSAIDSQSSYTFSATLAYARIPNDSEFRWREISFWKFNYEQSKTPFALDPGGREFIIATSNVVGLFNVAHGPISIDAEDEETFQDRWLTLFAKAAQRTLRPPMQMPLPKSYFQ